MLLWSKDGLDRCWSKSVLSIAVSGNFHLDPWDGKAAKGSPAASPSQRQKIWEWVLRDSKHPDSQTRICSILSILCVPGTFLVTCCVKQDAGIDGAQV